MKKILIDRNKNFYKANLHCHSTKSDGNMTVEELKAHYKANGYSIIAFTDHEHLIDNSYLNDEGFLAITSCEIAIKQFPDQSTLKNWAMKVCHLNLYARDAHNIDTPCYSSVADHFLNDEIRDLVVHTCGEYQRKYSPEGMREIIDTCREKGFLVAYNHPRWSLENARDYLEYKGLWAVEIYNNECNVNGLYEYDINVYDDFLRDGERIACTATDDNHSVKSTCGGWTVINADKLDYPTVMDALFAGEFYASTGPEIYDLFVDDDNVLRVKCSDARMIAFVTPTKIRGAVNSENGVPVNSGSFQISDGIGYVRVVVTDFEGKCAYSNPIFVDDINI